MTKIKKRKTKRKIRSKRKRTRNMHTKDALKALRKSLLDISKDFSEGADKIASVLVEDNKKHKGVKAKKLKRLKKELAATIRDVGNDIKKGLKNVKPKDIFSSTSYEMGKLLKATKDTYVKILDNLIK